MKGIPAAMLLILSATPLCAATLGTPTLSPPLATPRFFDPDRFLTSGGLKYHTTTSLTVEPEVGVGYRESEREFAGGIEESIHRVHAQAGWRVALSDTMYLSAAAKLPLLTVEKAGLSTGQDIGSRQNYDFTRSFRKSPSWTGEVGLHVTSWSDLMLYYDQSPVSGWLSGGPHQEERIGTRIIFKFD